MEKIDLKLKFSPHAPTAAQFDRADYWLVIAPPGKLGARVPHAALLARRHGKMARTETDKDPLVTQLPDARGTRVALVRIKPDLEQFKLLTLARKLVAGAVAQKVPELHVLVGTFAPRQAGRIAEAVCAAALAAAADLPSFKNKREKRALHTVHLHGVADSPRFARTRAEAEGNALARRLTVLPSNHLTPAMYVKEARVLAKRMGWQVKFHDLRALKRLGAGAFGAVAQGSAEGDAGILHLKYSPGGPRGSRGLRGAPVALVGKGICFDTGGHNLKTGNYMYGMHGDMQGSAVALGILYALTRLKVKFEADCWLALAMNHIGPKAYKPNDVVTAVNGISIEVVDTDAEGRMVLADTLALAARREPRLILDFATLTGSMKRALGGFMSGVFTNREEWVHRLIETGRQSGERVWPFPLDDDYDAVLESEIADVKQCANDPGPDHIHAARFLQRFVGKAPWIHKDLSAGGNRGGLGHIPTNKTGFGIRFSLNLLLDQELV